MIRIRPLTLTVITALLGLATAAWADCPDGVRNPTPGELSFAARATAALAAALPAPIADSQRRGAPFDFAQPPSLSFCKGDPEGAFSVGVSAPFLYTFPKAEADRLGADRKRLNQQIAALEALPPAKEAQYNELIAQMRVAYDAAPRRSRKDPPLTPEQQAQADRANAEGKRLENAAKAVQSEHLASVKPETDALRAQAKRLETFPQEIVVRIAINLERFPEAGPFIATFGAASARRSAGLRTHNIVLHVEGPDGDATRAFMTAVDASYLRALVGQPLPDIDTSKARAQQVAAAAPVAVVPSGPAAAAAAAPTAAQGAATPPAAASAPASPAPQAPAPTAAAGPATAPPASTTEDPKKGNGTGAAITGAAQGVRTLRGLLRR